MGDELPSSSTTTTPIRDRKKQKTVSFEFNYTDDCHETLADNGFLLVKQVEKVLTSSFCDDIEF